MANGVAALRVALEPAPHSEATAGGAGAAATEITIGQAVAAAVTGLGFALQEYGAGGLTNQTRTANGARIAALYEMQQAHAGALDFALVARREGKVALRQFLAASDFYCQHTTEQGDAVLDMFIDGVLTVLSKVTALEAAWAN